MKIVFASNNTHKLGEVRAILSTSGIEMQGLQEAGLSGEIEETGSTLRENAWIKAKSVFDRSGLPSFADDSGLEVSALGGAPGVYSARYAGEPGNAEANVQKLLCELEGKTDRAAAFVTVICLILPGQEPRYFEGRIEGSILTERTGAGGFGYDPVFLPRGYNQSFAEMTAEQKNAISHRSIAVRKFSDFLLNYFPTR